LTLVFDTTLQNAKSILLPIWLVPCMLALCKNYCLTPRPHRRQQFFEIGFRDSCPHLRNSCPQLVVPVKRIFIAILYPIFHPIPHDFNWVQIRRMRRPSNTNDASFLKILNSASGRMSRCATLHERKALPCSCLS
jgi:hypothetical protein